MRPNLTTIFGVLGAIALALSNVKELPATAHLLCVCVGSACIAALGYHAANETPRPPLPPLGLLCLLVGFLALGCAGCKLGGFGLKVSSNTFGSLALGIDGGVIGHGKMPTNSASSFLPP